jgi:mono/diheme cytochrome c family protein
VSKKAVNRHIATVGVALAITISGQAVAADIRQGRVVAEQWCAACHFVDGRQEATDAAPPFAQMANDPAFTEARLRNWLAAPHPPMPKLDLNRYTIDDLVAYIQSLKH